MDPETTSASKRPVYKNPHRKIEERVENLLGRMTLEEKIAQLVCVMAERLRSLGKPIIALVFSGRLYILNRLDASVDALAQCWYLGQATGHAVARVLFGEVSPSGRLPLSLPRSTGQVPVFYNQKAYARQRGYLFEPTEPLYSFGHGLGYSAVEYSLPKISAAKAKIGESVTIAVTVSRPGSVPDGVGSVPIKEIVQL